MLDFISWGLSRRNGSIMLQLPFLSAMAGHGFFWFRILGLGLHFTDGRRNPPCFSERYGYLKFLKVGRFRIRILWPSELRPFVRTSDAKAEAKFRAEWEALQRGPDSGQIIVVKPEQTETCASASSRSLPNRPSV